MRVLTIKHLLRIALCSVLVACQALHDVPGVPTEYEPADVAGAIEQARAELAEGKVEEAFARMRVADTVRAVPNQVRATVQQLLENAARERIALLEDPEELQDMLDMDLPRQITVSAGIAGSRKWLEKGERLKAFNLIKRIDQSYPNHHERPEAGRLLADIGFSFAQDNRRYKLFFHYRSLAPGVLEYLVLNYPSAPRGDEAYWVLGAAYSGQLRWQLAIEKYEDLVLWYPESRYSIPALAMIPHLRLKSIESPEYDRSELVRARADLERWLTSHTGHELEEQVRFDLADSIRRLADNDLVIGRFYQTVNNQTGAEYHARRAIEQAREGGDPAQLEEAEALLSALQAGAEATP